MGMYVIAIPRREIASQMSKTSGFIRGSPPVIEVNRKPLSWRTSIARLALSRSVYVNWERGTR